MVVASQWRVPRPGFQTDRVPAHRKHTLFPILHPHPASQQTFDYPVTGLPIGTQSSNRSNGDGPSYAGGVSGGAYYTFANGLQLGLDAGVLAFHASATVNWTNVRSEYTFRGFGPFANLSLGLRF